jgi:hypothetical protein
MPMSSDLQRDWHDFVVAEAGLAGLDGRGRDDPAVIEAFAAAITPDLFCAWIKELSAEDQFRVHEAMVADAIARFSGRLQVMASVSDPPS